MRRRSRAGVGPTGRRVLLVTHEASLSGAPRIALLVARLLAERGHVVQILSRRPGPMDEEFAAVGRFWIEPLYQVRRRLWRTAGLRWIALALDQGLAMLSIIRSGADLVYLNSTASIAYLRPALWLGRRVVVHSHESAEVSGQFLTPVRALGQLKRARLVGCSPAVQQSLAELAGVPVAEVVLLPSVPDTARVLTLADSAPAGSYRPDEVVVGCCGTVEQRKGADLWLQSITLVRAALPDVALRFVWIGSVGDPALAAAGGDDVFVGPSANPYAEMNRFDIATLPSRDDPFPLVVMESMLLRKPIVAFAVGGVPDQLGETGLLVAEQDVVGFANAIISLVLDQDQRRELGRRAQDRALGLFSTEGFATILDGVLAGRMIIAVPTIMVGTTEESP